MPQITQFTAVKIFGTLTFLASTSHWDIKNMCHISLKNLYWKQDVNVLQKLKTIQFQIPNLQLSLADTENMIPGTEIRSKIISIEQQLTTFEFIESLHTWYAFVKSKFCQ